MSKALSLLPMPKGVCCPHNHLTAATTSTTNAKIRSKPKRKLKTPQTIIPMPLIIPFIIAALRHRARQERRGQDLLSLSPEAGSLLLALLSVLTLGVHGVHHRRTLIHHLHHPHHATHPFLTFLSLH